MKIGYARVSTLDQNPDLQTDALEKAGCERVLVDKVSGAADHRPNLEMVKEMLRPGDTLVVWRLDRLGRSLRDLIETVREVEEQGGQWWRWRACRSGEGLGFSARWHTGRTKRSGPLTWPRSSETRTLGLVPDTRR